MPEVSTVHISQPLTNYAVGYPSGNLISERIFPTLPVQKQFGQYYIFDAARRANAQVDDLRAPGTAANEVDFALTTGTYYTEGHELAAVVPDEERENADAPISPELNKTEFLIQRVGINQEINAKTILDAALTGDMTSDPTNEWDDYTLGDPAADIRLAVNAIEDATGKTPNKIFMDIKVWRALRDHPDLIDRVKYGGGNANPAQVGPQAFAELFGLDEVVIGNEFKNIAIEGQAASMSRIWGSDVYVAFTSPTPYIKTPSLGYRITWSPFSGAVNGWKVEKARLDLRHADRVAVSKYYQQKVCLAGAGYRLQNRLT